MAACELLRSVSPPGAVRLKCLGCECIELCPVACDANGDAPLVVADESTS